MNRSASFGMRSVLVAAITAAASTQQAQAGYGPYVGIEGGVSLESPQNLYVTGKVTDTLHFKDGWIAGFNTGYSFASGLRPELEFAFRQNYIRHTGTPPNGGREEMAQISGMFWYDYKTKAGLFSTLHPSIGFGGIGGRLAARNSEIEGTGPKNEFRFRPGLEFGGGLGWDITPRWTLSGVYRYVMLLNGHFDIGPTGALARYRAHAAMLDLRYSFGEAPQPPKELYCPPPPEPPKVVQALPPPPPPAPAPCRVPAGFKVDADCHIVEQTLVVRAIDFEFNSDRLTAPAMQTLDEIAPAFVAQPELNVEIRGHTDSIGGDAYNLKLSNRRAESVRSYLASKGVNASNLTAIGFGKTRPIADNSTAEGRAQNRRVEFEVSNTNPGVKINKEGASSASTSAAQSGEPLSVSNPHAASASKAKTKKAAPKKKKKAAKPAVPAAAPAPAPAN